MHLTDEEKRMLAGEEGEAVSVAMQILTRLGDVYEAKRMVPVRSVHGGGRGEVLERFAELGAKFRTVTTSNGGGDPAQYERWPDCPEPDEVKQDFRRATDLHRQMGLIPNLSCTPYFQGNLPRLGECVSWSESSAVIFANSVLGARTNRTVAGLDISAAVTGRVPEFGLLLDENRVGNTLVKMEFQPRDIFDYNTVGFIIGEACNGKVPVIEGLPPWTTANELKYMGAAAAFIGGIALYHAVGITPEARTKEDAFRGRKPELELVIRERDVKAAVEKLNTSKGGRVDAVFIGCPHSTVSEIKEVAELLSGKKVRHDIKFCLFTSGDALRCSRQMGYINVIEASGARILEGICFVGQPFEAWGWKNIATNSAKCAQYSWFDSLYTDIKGCVEVATA